MGEWLIGLGLYILVKIIRKKNREKIEVLIKASRKLPR